MPSSQSGLQRADTPQSPRLPEFVGGLMSCPRQRRRYAGAPGITAHEAAGELWLRVRRYADAKRAYEHARSVVGSTPLIEAGLARAEEALRR